MFLNTPTCMPVKISSDIYVGVKALMDLELTDVPQEKCLQ